jgi:hypothetical protein
MRILPAPFLDILADEDAHAPARVQQTHNNEITIGLGNGVCVDLQALRKFANRRKLVARLQAAGGDGILDGVLDLRVDGRSSRSSVDLYFGLVIAVHPSLVVVGGKVYATVADTIPMPQEDT